MHPEVCGNLMSAVNTIVCCSRYVRGRLVEVVKTTHPTVAPPRFEVLHPRVVSGAIFVPDRRARSTMRRELGLRPTDFMVFFPSRFFDADGSFSAHKGPLVALRAFADFARVVHRTKFLGICPRGFFGKTEERKAREKMRSIVHALGIERQTLIIDRAIAQREMAQYYRAADVVLIPSVEGFGLVYLEAMGCDVPVVGIAQGASREVIGADAGILVAAGDRLQDRLTSALIRLYEDPELSEHTATAARERFQSQFSNDGYGMELEALLARWAK
jgi:glycosyltransferase involved in cell wall biosynthesis